MAKLREVKSSKKSTSVIKIDRDRTYHRALKAEVDINLFRTRELTFKMEVNEELSQKLEEVEAHEVEIKDA